MSLACDISNLCNRFGDKKVFEMLKAAGFDGVDYSFYEIKPLGGLVDDDYLEKAKKLRLWLDEAGLICNQTHAPFEFSYGDELDCSGMNYRNIVRCMEISAIMGAKCIVIHAITPPDGVDIFEYNTRFYRSFIPYCEKFGIEIAVENIARGHSVGKQVGIFETAKQLCDFVYNLGSPWFCVCVDLGHAAIMNESPEKFISEMKPELLKVLHVHDTDYYHDCHTLPYLQKQNWDAIIEALKTVKYKGDFSLEVLAYTASFPDELVEPALSFAAEVGKYLVKKFNN